ncbi:MAG: response regulator [Chloroflexi bacterium]|nr:response regulator [Chloroflexota bacterium]
MAVLSTEEIVSHLRRALRNLYVPVVLSRSPLVSLLSLEDEIDPSSELRRILKQTIEDLKPAGDASSHCHAWRTYEVLFYRYVEQLSRQEVAEQLGLSVRQTGREHRKALEALAYLVQPMCMGSVGSETKEIEQAEGNMQGSDLAWLGASRGGDWSDLYEELPNVLTLLEPLAAQYGTHVDILLDESLPHLAVHPTALRQILLGLATGILGGGTEGPLRISATQARSAVQIHVDAPCRQARDRGPGARDKANWAITRKLAQLYRGTVSMRSSNQEAVATVSLPTNLQIPVLVIDDNADVIQLLQRYALNTRYHVTATNDPAEALTMVEKLKPQVVCLDIMMPNLDGWDLLRALRSHASSADMRIIVCTVLAQEELASTLGANGYLRKPVRREEFIAELDRQVSEGC